ncbi:unnamed protein product [Chilo suppressalis]|uniref:Acyl-coenzyme A oxidase n=1 Tax=Chilo suppressalis TaxID=168631 RepID=A0ABN8ECU2_CHISP|nr:unnamed protein product [Chilo suppressalis]
MAVNKVNEDLLRERARYTFNIEELTNFIDGGEEGTRNRREVEDMVIHVKELHDEVPEDYLSHKERYENAVKKGCILIDLLKEHVLRHSSFDAYKPSNMYRVLSMAKEVSPVLLHMGMFVPTIFGQASAEQQEEWLHKALMLEIIGTYAQTELGHGTFLRGLETTATYDPSTEEFVLHSPTLTSYKWWPGGLGQTANHCIVVAQLYSREKCYGVHAFLVQIRDSETHMPLPGIKVGDIGPKLGFQTANNGFLGFDHFRIPRKNMLMRNAQVLKDGRYVKSKSDKLTYGTMMLVRVMIVSDAAYELSRAATIAARYSAVRRQSMPRPGQPEPQILDYVTQQHKVFIAIATSHALRLTGGWLWDAYSSLTHDLDQGNLDQLPELHALACCLKAISSRDSNSLVEQCRMSCGGHGYMSSSNFPTIYGATAATVTYEGEYTVMLLQTARYLMKAWKEALGGIVLTPTVAYMVTYNKAKPAWVNTPEAIIQGFHAVAVGKVKEAADGIEYHQNSGKDYEDAWNAASVMLVKASECYCRAIICETFWKEIQKHSRSMSRNLAVVLQQLSELYLSYWVLERSGDFFQVRTVPLTRTKFEFVSFASPKCHCQMCTGFVAHITSVVVLAVQVSIQNLTLTFCTRKRNEFDIGSC